MKRKLATIALALGSLAAEAPTLAQTGAPATGVACPLNGGLAAELSTLVCYRCFFPIQIAGVPHGPNVPNPARVVPPVCVCPSSFMGIPTPGVTYGQWLPHRIIETVRMPFCSTVGNNMLGSGSGAAGGAAALSMRLVGGFAGNEDSGGSREGYYHFHLFAFPMGVLMDMNISMMCKSNEAMDMDLLYLSELDPTWNNDELAIALTPEAALFANDAALLACLADSVAASATQPLDALFWCAGAWGEMYPHTGHSPHKGSPAQTHSLVQTRAIAAMHRRGLANQMMGPSAICANHPQPIIPKSQYKLQTLFPIPEAVSNHWIGANTFRWGEHRNIPGFGEDWVSVVWAYEQCCLND